MAIIASVVFCLFFVLIHAGDIIDIVIVLNSGRVVKPTYKTSEPISHKLSLNEEMTAELSDLLDFELRMRDWKLKSKSMEAFRNNKKLQVSSIINNIKYDLQSGLMAVGFPAELDKPIHPVIYAMSKNKRPSILSIETRDWRRYMKAENIDTAATVSPSSHHVHIPREELKVIEKLTRKHGKIVKIKAGSKAHINILSSEQEAHINEHDLYSVTTCNLRDELIELSNDKRLNGVCESDMELAEGFLNDGLNEEEMLEAISMYNKLQQDPANQKCAIM